MAIPEQTVRAMLTTVREAAFAEDLPKTVISCLHEVVGADWASYSEFRPDGAVNLADPVAPSEIDEAWARFGNQHPSLAFLREHPQPRVVRLSDVATQRRVRGLDLWDHVFKPLRIRHQLNIPLYDSGGELVGLALSRSGRDFSDSELAVMELLRADLSRIFLARKGPSLAAFERAGLTRREAEVLALAARSTNREIAETLGISRRTVEKHLEHAYRKLSASSRAEALAKLH